MSCFDEPGPSFTAIIRKENILAGVTGISGADVSESHILNLSDRFTYMNLKTKIREGFGEEAASEMVIEYVHPEIEQTVMIRNSYDWNQVSFL